MHRLQAAIIACAGLLAALLPAPVTAREVNLDLVTASIADFRYEEGIHLVIAVRVPAESYAVLQTIYLAIDKPDDPSAGRIRMRFREAGLVNGRTHPLDITIPPGGSEDHGIYEILLAASEEGQWPDGLRIIFAAEEGTPAGPPRTLVKP